MPVVPVIKNIQPVVGGSADTWGSIVNDRLQETYADINALATQGNANETAVTGKVNKAGDTLTGDLVLANVNPTSQYSAGFRGAPVVSTDQDRTFGLTDSGKMVRLFGTASRTWTIPPASSVGFPIGTVIVLRNYASASLSLARGAGVSLRVPGSAADANRTLAANALVTLTHEDTNLWIASGVGVT